MSKNKQPAQNAKKPKTSKEGNRPHEQRAREALTNGRSLVSIPGSKAKGS
jgi:hypothetical protein